MKTEAVLFAGVAVFFGVTASVYGAWARDPAGTAVLIVAFLMAALVSFFLTVQYRRRGRRPQDTRDAEVADTAGPVEFFPPDTSPEFLQRVAVGAWETLAMSALGTALAALAGLALALPASRLHEGQPLRITRRAGRTTLSLELPFADRDDLELGRRGDELLVRVGPYRRAITLPDSLRSRPVLDASLRQGRLRVTFGGSGDDE